MPSPPVYSAARVHEEREDDQNPVAGVGGKAQGHRAVGERVGFPGCGKAGGVIAPTSALPRVQEREKLVLAPTPALPRKQGREKGGGGARYDSFLRERGGKKAVARDESQASRNVR